MKTILIATDFSKASRNAGQYGFALARIFDAKAILLNAYYEQPIPVSDSLAIATPEDMHRVVENFLKEEARELDLGKTVPVETICVAGRATAAILNSAKKTKADLIILGMKKSDRELGKFFGTKVTELAKKTTIPLLVIPEESQYAIPETIALADDTRLSENNHVLDILMEFTRQFDSKLYVVRVFDKKSPDSQSVRNKPSSLKRLAISLNPEYENLRDKSITHALTDFIVAKGVDILAMIPHKHSLPGRWLLKSNSRAMVFETRIPLLILPDLRPKKLFRRAKSTPD